MYLLIKSERKFLRLDTNMIPRANKQVVNNQNINHID